ncbi:hypothetical protein V8E55_006861, partial [Tylopilus felleus]
VIKDQWIVERLLAQEGIRLAAVNWIFAEVGEDELKRTYYLASRCNLLIAFIFTQHEL